jgi:3-deoxy-D-manno-octulosonate 8-phosphate phosphatase (KDO 8-P phosphatase)
MGLNMLRFSYWLIHGKLPVVGIITGANNLTAIEFAKRENIHAIRINSKNKRLVVNELTSKFGYSPNETLFVYDDILDLNAAEISLLSICVKRNSSPIFNQFIINNSLCNYITANEGGKHAVRELTELLIGINGNFEETVSKRMEHIGEYQNYLKDRNTIKLNIE